MCTITEIVCHYCGLSWWWPKKVDSKRRRSGQRIYCPYCGGRWHFVVGKTKEQRLKEQLDATRAEAEQLAACCSELAAQVKAREYSIRGYQGVVGRMRNKLGREDRGK